MKLRVVKENTEKVKNELIQKGYNELAEVFNSRFYGDEKRAIDIDLNCKVRIEEIRYLHQIGIDLDDFHLSNDSLLIIQMLLDSESSIIRSLNGFLKAFEAYIKKDMIDGWFYNLDKSGNYMPYLIDNIKHVPHDPETNVKAHICIFYDYTSPRKETQSFHRNKNYISFFLTDVYNKTILQALGEKRFFKETKELKKKYENHLDSYEKYHSKIGMQFIATSNGINRDHSYSENNIIKGHKLVNDQFETDEMESIKQNASTSFFNKGDLDDFEEVNNPNFEVVQMKLPFHPYIKMFDLEAHNEIWILPGDMTPYVYDNSVYKKLVLPNDHRDLIDVLVYDADVVLEDIINNKSGGTSILCKGAGGLGKTLTAEVYSETIGKPLYLIHSGQLGTDPDSIDKRLDKILKQAERWGAILLLDEADVYIRKRDNSMRHNAIVAAFLRKIERFNGIIFMTTNRSDDVDDAIVSRCIAVITYDYPKDEELKKLWKVLSTQYKINLSDDLIDKLCNMFEKTSGRDIKELLKLASKFKSQRGIEVDEDIFRKCAMFRGLKTKN